jgi:hypothetical protein
MRCQRSSPGIGGGDVGITEDEATGVVDRHVGEGRGKITREHVVAAEEKHGNELVRGVRLA